MRRDRNKVLHGRETGIIKRLPNGEFIEVFLDTDFTGEERHSRRIGMLADYEKTGNLPPLPDSAIRPTSPE